MKIEKTATDVHADLSGFVNIKFLYHETLDDFCKRYIPDYNPDRFEAIALKLYVRKEMTILVYAVDKIRMEGTTHNPEKVPVKKFKIHIPLDELFSRFEEFNFTAKTDSYELEDMEVINR